MHITLPHRLELCEEKSVAFRNQIMRDHNRKNYHFLQVIFNGTVDIEMDVKVPTCDLIKINSDRFRSILGNDMDSVNDHLHDMEYLSRLPDSRIDELKELLHENLLSECMKYTLFLDTGMCCKTNQLSKRTQKKTFHRIPFPTDNPYMFCWLQILPLLQAYPRSYIPSLHQEYVIMDVRVFTTECNLIHEQAAGEKTFFLDVLKKGENDPYSYIYNNQTDYDIHCILNQCETFLKKQDIIHPSYRTRFIQFLVYHPQAGLAYMAKKLTQMSHKDRSYLWYL